MAKHWTEYGNFTTLLRRVVGDNMDKIAKDVKEDIQNYLLDHDHYVTGETWASVEVKKVNQFARRVGVTTEAGYYLDQGNRPSYGGSRIFPVHAKALCFRNKQGKLIVRKSVHVFPGEHFIDKIAAKYGG